VTLGLAVETVYGFTVCGYDCSNENTVKRDETSKAVTEHGTYSVGLFKLTAPQSLGDLFTGEQYRETFSTDCDDGLKLLIRFLNQGKRSKVTDPKPRECLGVPCFFAVPTSLWDDTDDRRLFQNGTRSIVFNVTAAGMLDLLDKVDSDVKDQRTRKAWKRYLQKTRAEYIDPAVQLERSSRNGKSGDSQSEEEDDGAISDTKKRKHHPTEETAMSHLSGDSLPFYIKVQTRDTSTHFNASRTENVISGLRSEEATESLTHEALSIYPVKPFTCVSFALLIMKNRGQRIEKSLFQSFPEFQRAFFTPKTLSKISLKYRLLMGTFSHTTSFSTLVIVCCMSLIWMSPAGIMTCLVESCNTMRTKAQIG
jgi:hypothetical protein